MIATVRPLAALLAGVALLLMGSGLLGTLLAVRGRLEGFDDQTLGLIMSGYFVGFFLGTYAAPGLIQRIGHIRAFAFYAALCAATVLLHPVFVSPWAWGLLRMATGIGLVGLYTVIESWLNVQAPPHHRSQVFAVYMAVNLFALAAGQWLIGLWPPGSFELFSLVAILVCLAALPVTASRMVQPELPPIPRLALAALYRAAPAATLGALLAGVALGGFWGLGAVFGTRIGLDVAGVAALMSATIVGGAALQWPIGRLSDGGDRRTALVIVCLLASAVAVALTLPVGQSGLPLYALFFVFGGLSFAIYPICMAHLLDHLAPEDTLSAGSSLLLLNGVGSAIGPALAGAAMTRSGPGALPAFFAVTLGLLAMIAGGRRLLRRRTIDHAATFQPMLRTTPTAIELLPETGEHPRPDAPSPPRPGRPLTHTATRDPSSTPSSTRPGTASTPPRMLLATDLDGTFLAGDAEHRQQLYRLVDRHPDVRLAFVTGRGLEAVMPLLSDPTLPRPDYVICDVGATVVDGRTLQPVNPLQGDIDARWPGEHAVADLIGDFPGLVRQDVPQERRCSYFCDPETLAGLRDAIEAAAGKLGCSVLYSADRYLDILPPDTDKGRTLLALADHLEVPHAHVLVAGDTLNDLSMFVAGFQGVVVGESEERLVEATRNLANVLHARAPGCGGILQAIGHFGLLPEEDLRLARPASQDFGRSELVMVYHRLPYEEYVEDGQVRRRQPRSPNGIIPSLLGFFAGGRKGSWVAWSIDNQKHGKFETHTTVDPELYPNLTAARVALGKAEVDAFYKRFSKEAFWPMLHTFWERARFREEDWRVFLKVNRKFAEATAAESAHGATVWLHDYNLWMVPAFLRELRPDLTIAFFHHTYFPSADVFNVVPWRREILGSLLQCDYIGFHIPRQVENFVDVVRGAMPFETVSRESCAPRFLTYGCAVGLDRMTTAIRVGDRQVALGAHPVGTDMGRIRAMLAREDVRERIGEVRREFEGRKLVLSIERLDYTKGSLEKLLAFERLLEQRPELRGTVTLLMVCVPAAQEMTVYRQLQTQIEQAVGRINGRHARLDWTPVRFFARGLPFDRVIAYYAAADIMWITPLRDGLNLVSKEFIAAHGVEDTAGVLVLSEFAGAAAELKGAVLTNPHDTADLMLGLEHALAMPPDEAESRQRQLFDIVSRYDVERWGREFLEAVEAAGSGQRAHVYELDRD